MVCLGAPHLYLNCSTHPLPDPTGEGFFDLIDSIGVGSSQHGLSTNKTALITSDCGATCVHDHQMALITSGRVHAVGELADDFPDSFLHMGGAFLARVLVFGLCCD